MDIQLHYEEQWNNFGRSKKFETGTIIITLYGKAIYRRRYSGYLCAL